MAEDLKGPVAIFWKKLSYLRRDGERAVTPEEIGVWPSAGEARAFIDANAYPKGRFWEAADCELVPPPG